jgi:hypothetical protein
MSEEDKRFTLRLDKQLFNKVAQQAKENSRSVGREIEHTLKQHINHQENKKTKG